MYRYILIGSMFFLYSGLNARKPDSIKLYGESVQKQDSVKTTTRNIQQLSSKNEKKVTQIADSVRYSPKVPPAIARVNKIDIVTKLQGLIKPSGKDTASHESARVFIKVFQVPVQAVKKPKIVHPPDSVRFTAKKPPEKAGPLPVNIVCKTPGLIRRPAAGMIKQDSPKVYIKVLRKQDATAFLTNVAPNEPPQKSVELVPHREELIVPAWLIAQRKAALEAEKLAAQLKLDSAKLPRARIIRQWNLSADFSEEVPVTFDTLFSLFNRYRITDLYSPVNAYLGNYGLPYYSLNFFDRINDPDKYLYYNLYHFMHSHENALFMNLQVPFTELKWAFSGERETSEQVFRITHSQNITRKLNFGLIYDIIFSLGQYSNQRSEDKTFTFYTSYTGSVYKLYVSAGVNGLFGQENGGITSKDELDILIADTRDVPVNLGSLNDAQSLLKNRNFLVVQRLTFLGAQPDHDTVPAKKSVSVPLTGTFSHIFQLDYSRRMYSDASPASGFYDSIYISTSKTFDSLSSKFVKNTFRFDFMTDPTKPVRMGAGFGFRNENFWFGQIIPEQDTIASDTANWFRGNNVLLGRFSSYIGDKFHWVVNGELFFDRYRQGDFKIDGLMSKSFDLKKGKLEWLITGALNRRTPSFWYSRWGGNNFRWNVDLRKESRMDIGTRVIFPARNMDLRFNFALINNYLDFDTLALPSQDTSTLSVLSLALKKDFRLWKFHLVPDVILQKSSNTEVLELSQASIRAAAYIEHVFNFKKTNGRLSTQLGIDVTYHTLYHPYNYMPSTGRFYRQVQTETGNYPFVNAFLNIKLKRTRFFLMFDHLNYGMMNPEMMYNYEMMPLYPLAGRRFAFGLAWTFYN